MSSHLIGYVASALVMSVFAYRAAGWPKSFNQWAGFALVVTLWPLFLLIYAWVLTGKCKP